MQYKNFITQSLLKASEIAKSSFGKVSSTTKAEDNNQVLTQTDIEIGKHLVAAVEKSFPDHNIIDEEAGVINKNSQFTWVIDPIDGTSNFANAVPTYGPMIGLLKDSIAIAGGVALPEFDELYVAEQGSGAFFNDKQISVTKETKLLSILVAYGIDGHQENPQITYDEVKILAEIILNIRNLRSTNCNAFEIAQVAKGNYGAFLNRTGKIWDLVAIQPIVEEAGGAFTDFFGKPVDYNNAVNRTEENFTLCTAAPELHKQLQTIIHSK